MSTKLDQQWVKTIVFVSYGVFIGIQVNDSSFLPRLLDFLPPNWESSSSSVVDFWYSLRVEETNLDSFYSVYRDNEKLIMDTDLDLVLDSFNSDLRLRIGMKVKDKLFVHAGVVGWRGQAIVIPGRSFSGKTTLTVALVKAGATYYSDEYAIFDRQGLVHAYPRKLSIRYREGEQIKKKDYPVEVFGGKAGNQPIPVGLVVQTEYHSGVSWCPREMSSGEAILALLDNTIVARTRPQFALSMLPHVVSGALTLEGKRSEAEEVAKVLLKQLEAFMSRSSVNCSKIS